MNDKSLNSLLEFLDWTAEKGLMAKNTVGGRKAAVSAVLGVLAPEEKSDVTEVDLDGAMVRFVNLQGKKYNTSSLNVYKSRTNAAINDFRTWLADPLSFKPHLAKSEKKIAPKIAKPKVRSGSTTSAEDGPSHSSFASAHQTTANVFPIPIRENVVVRIHNLPFDLTAAEAEKIANVVKAMAMT
jgi:hypothetical protein